MYIWFPNDATSFLLFKNIMQEMISKKFPMIDVSGIPFIYI